MRAADLSKAQDLSRQLDATRHLLARMETGEKLALIVGGGSDATSIELSPSYLERLQGDIVGSLRLRCVQLAAMLAELGVEADR